MCGQGRPVRLSIVPGLLQAACACWAMFCVNAPAAAPASEPTPRQDDANLHDVQFVGRDAGWAVGEQGVIWRTEDGGRAWRMVPSPVTETLRSVCFPTDRAGWIVGGGTHPHTRAGYGVVLATRDAGASWEVHARDDLPQLHYVRFFSLEHGIAVGEATPRHPTGVFLTEDGGRTWELVPGESFPGWRTACFTHPEAGVVAGLRGQVSLVGGGRMLPPRLARPGLRNLRSVKVDADDVGWLVGDGGLVLRTDNGGVVWEAPAALPGALRGNDPGSVFDFRAIEFRGERAWIAGRPGSVVWHTGDGGRTWSRQFTGQHAPIAALHFTSDTAGFAVGALGMMLRTTDGGETWQAVRGGERRAALMAVAPRPGRVPLQLLAQQSGDLGYRSFVLLPVRRDLGPEGHEELDLDLRLTEAVTAAGGSAADVGWQFPVEIPGLDRDADRLVQDWNDRSEGRLAEVFLGGLVLQIRTWRPSVLVLDQAGPDDAVASLLQDAVLRAVDQAADPTRFLQHEELAGLGPWEVSKVYLRQAPGSTGQAHVDPHEYLPRLGESVFSVAAAAGSRLVRAPAQTARREAWRLVVDRTAESDQADRGSEPSGRLPGAGGFFGGVALAPGSDARRRLVPYDDREEERRRKLVQRQRNFQAYAERTLDDPQQAAQLVGQLRSLTAGMTDSQAALQLLHLAGDYRDRAHWSLVEATLAELVERYPDQPAAIDAMRWLILYWSGTEPTYQRVRRSRVERRRVTSDSQALLARIENSFQPAGADSEAGGLASQAGGTSRDREPDPLRILVEAGSLDARDDDPDADWRTEAVKKWHDQAARTAALLRQKSPALYHAPEVQFPLAALMRQRRVHRLADDVYRRHAAGAERDPWTRAAEGELWLLQPLEVPQRPVAVCQFTREPPVLDGVLSDECWQEAEVIRLAGPPGRENAEQHGTDPAFVMLAYDLDYLYFAASMPRVPGTRTDGPQLAGRKHDADLADFDRIALLLDVDRNYGTWYALEVDQRGWTADACWEDASWNPKWFVAADADDMRWRIEAAIPIRELVPMVPVRNTVWSVGIVRTVPAVGVQSWTHPAASSRPRPEGFGLLRFE